MDGDVVRVEGEGSNFAQLKSYISYSGKDRGRSYVLDFNRFWSLTYDDFERSKIFPYKLRPLDSPFEFSDNFYGVIDSDPDWTISLEGPRELSLLLIPRIKPLSHLTCKWATPETKLKFLSICLIFNRFAFIKEINFPPEMVRAVIYNLEVLVRKDSLFLNDDEPW